MKYSDISKASNIFYKLASTFEPPPKIKEEITSWAQRRFAGQVWARIKPKFDKATKYAETGFDPKLILEAQKTVFKTKRIINECAKYIQSPDSSLLDKTEITIPLTDLISDWKYLTTKKENITNLLNKAGFDNEFPIHFLF